DCPSSLRAGSSLHSRYSQSEGTTVSSATNPGGLQTPADARRGTTSGSTGEGPRYRGRGTMNAPTNHHRLQMLTAAAVLTFAMAMAWSAGAIARPIDDPTLGVASSYTSQAKDQAAQAAQTDYPAGLRRTYSGASPTAGSGELSTPPVT